jgi:hypothetical protein
VSTLLRVLVMTLDATGMVSFWESSPPSLSITDARSVIEQCAAWKGSHSPGKALAVVALATGHRPRLVPFLNCSESAQRAWSFGCWSLGLTPKALLLPEAPGGLTML